MLTSKICFIFSIFKVRFDLFFWRFLWHRFWLSLPIFTSLKHRNSLGNEYLPSLLHLLLTDDYLRNFDPNFNGPLFIWLKWFFFRILSNQLFALHNTSNYHSNSDYFTFSISQIYFCYCKFFYHGQSVNFWGFLLSSIRYVTCVTLMLHQNLLKMTHSSQVRHLKINLFWSYIPRYYKNIGY